MKTLSFDAKAVISKEFVAFVLATASALKKEGMTVKPVRDDLNSSINVKVGDTTVTLAYAIQTSGTESNFSVAAYDCWYVIAVDGSDVTPVALKALSEVAIKRAIKSASAPATTSKKKIERRSAKSGVARKAKVEASDDTDSEEESTKPNVTRRRAGKRIARRGDKKVAKVAKTAKSVKAKKSAAPAKTKIARRSSKADGTATAKVRGNSTVFGATVKSAGLTLSQKEKALIATAASVASYDVLTSRATKSVTSMLRKYASSVKASKPNTAKRALEIRASVLAAI